MEESKKAVIGILMYGTQNIDLQVITEHGLDTEEWIWKWFSPIKEMTTETEMEPIMQYFSDMTPDEFKQARGVLGLSQMKMANALEVSYQTIQAWEQGRNPINKVVEMAVLHLLNTSGKSPKEL